MTGRIEEITLTYVSVLVKDNTTLGSSLPGILGGALIVESLFNYPGMGLLFWECGPNRGLPSHVGHQPGGGRQWAALRP